MRTLYILALVLLIQRSPAAEEPRTSAFDETFMFMYFATLEGAFRDGLSSADVELILQEKPAQGHTHFIYSCPLCMPVINALRSYQKRPPLYGYKLDPTSNQDKENTLGSGLTTKQQAQLRSPEFAQRLVVINGLVERWVKQRLDLMHPSESERKHWLDALATARKKGMDSLKSLAGNWGAAGFSAKDECAVCNASVGLGVKLFQPK